MRHVSPTITRQAKAVTALVMFSFGAPTLAAAQRTLDELVAIGLKQNLGQRQSELMYQRSDAVHDSGEFAANRDFAWFVKSALRKLLITHL